MANTLICDVVTPEAMLFSGTAVMVGAPAGEGDIGLMHQCSPLMSTLKRGTIRIKGENEETTVFAVDGGYLEADGHKVVVLASHAINVAEIDKDYSKDRIAADEKNLAAMSEDDPSRAFAEAELSWQQYLLSLV